MRSVFSLFIFAALSFTQAAQADGDHVILILGDSLSAAYGMELGESWPSLLQTRLIEHGHAYRVFNSSITGDTTEGGLARLPRLLVQYQPEFVLIELGANDGLRGLSLDITRQNLQSMITQSQAIGAKVVLLGIHLPPNYGKTYTQKFNTMFTELGNDPNIGFIPFLLEGIALDSSLMLDDGIHPTAQAQPMVLQTVWQVLEPVLKPVLKAEPDQ